MLDHIGKEIKDCEMLLIGIGEQVSWEEQVDFNHAYTKEEWASMVQRGRKRKTGLVDFYNELSDVIANKNYFMITTNVEGAVEESRMNPIRVVAPCGSVNRLQCACPGPEGIVKAPTDYYEKSENYRCPTCGRAYVPNIYNKMNYNESGYLKQWNLYNKWLQGTLNKKLLVLELGCGFTMMSLIRMPFEKIVLINQKSKYYRVNDKFPQITAELADRMTSVKENPVDFVQKLKDCSI